MNPYGSGIFSPVISVQPFAPEVVCSVDLSFSPLLRFTQDSRILRSTQQLPFSVVQKFLEYAYQAIAHRLERKEIDFDEVVGREQFQRAAERRDLLFIHFLPEVPSVTNHEVVDLYIRNREGGEYGLDDDDLNVIIKFVRGITEGVGHTYAHRLLLGQSEELVLEPRKGTRLQETRVS